MEEDAVKLYEQSCLREIKRSEARFQGPKFSLIKEAQENSWE